MGEFRPLNLDVILFKELTRHATIVSTLLMIVVIYNPVVISSDNYDGCAVRTLSDE